MPPRLNADLINQVKSKILDHCAPKNFSVFIAGKSDFPIMLDMASMAFGDEASPVDMYDYYLKQGHALMFGLKKETDIASYAVIEFNRRQKRVYIVEIVTAEKYRGQKLGQWLLKKTAEIGKRLGYTTITCHIRPEDSRSIHVHEQIGLRIKKHLKDYYVEGGDAVYMQGPL